MLSGTHFPIKPGHPLINLRFELRFATYEYDPILSMFFGAVSNLSSRFTGKERDAETGLDYFLARYYSGAQGRFTGTDPVTITSERLMDPQQLNAYAYVRNNPLKLIDPTGMILQLSGDIAAAKDYLCQIAGGDLCGRIGVDSNNIVTFDITDLDLDANAGAALINDMIRSAFTYDFSVGPKVLTADGEVEVTYLMNLPPFPSQVAHRKSKSPTSGETPRQGVNDQVAFNPHYS